MKSFLKRFIRLAASTTVLYIYVMATSYTMQEQKLLGKIGARIRAYRNDTKLSQEDFAKKCDLDRTYISDVERGERNVSVLNLFKIAKALNVPAASLLDIK